MSKSKVVYHRDESKLHNIPKFFPVIMAFETLAMFILIVVCIVFLIKQDFLTSGVCGGIALILYLHGVFSDHYYNWHEGVCYEVGNDYIVYTYNLNECAMTSNTKVTIKVLSVESYKVKGKKIQLRGTFRKKAPMKKEIELNKVLLQIDLKEKNEILVALDKLKERSK